MEEEKPTYLSDEIGKFILRLAVAGLLLPHGIQKIINSNMVNDIGGLLKANGLPEFLAYGVFVGEVAAPVLILLGFLTRPAALIVMINMGMAVWLGHSQDVVNITADWTHYFRI